MFFELLIIFGLAILNGFLAMAELSLVSARKTWLEQRSLEGDTRAAVALELTEKPEEFLSAIQCGITLIGILAGAFGGATIAARLEEFVIQIPLLVAYSKPISFGVVVALITYITIVFGELTPKTLALNYAEPIALASARPMKFVSWLATPVARILSASTQALLRSLRIDQPRASGVTEAEIKTLIEQSGEEGTLPAEEQQMLERVFRLGDRSITLLMTPRKNVVWLDVHDTLEVNVKKMVESNHTQFPVCDSSPDNIIGMVSIKAVLSKLVEDVPLEFRDLLTPPLYIPDNLPSLRVLRRFHELKTHIAIVLDEYGSFEGVITLNDFMDALLGTMGEGVMEDPPVVTRPDGSWLIDGQFAVDELKELLEVHSLPEEEQGNYETLAGLLMTLLQRIPKIGDRVEWENFSFEIVDMDVNRVDRVLVTKKPTPSEEAA